MLHVEAATDLPPSIAITSEIPSETTSEELIIEGIVSDDKGIVTSSVRVFDSSGKISSISSLEKIQGDEKQFEFSQQYSSKYRREYNRN